MKKTKRALITSAGLLATFSLIAASCGSDDDEASSTTTTAAPLQTQPRQEVTLKLGSILPQSGGLSFLGPPMIRATEMAVEEINAAGKPISIDYTPRDSGTDPAVAGGSVDALLSENVDAMIGAAASSISLSIIDKVTGAGVIMVSPSNTSPQFTNYPDNGYYFRTAPSDVLQGSVIANLVVDDGNSSVGILYRGDDYGRNLADITEADVEAAGADVAQVIRFDHEASSYAAEAQAMRAAGVDSIVIIAFEEGIEVMKALIEVGLGPDSVNIYITDGLAVEDLGERVNPGNPGIVSGIKGTAPAAIPASGEATFETRFREFAPEVEDLIFSSASYDGVIILALASLIAESTDAENLKDVINDVTKGGTKCTRFAQCADLVLQGTNIDYDGASGTLEFSDAGEPSAGVYDVYEFQSDGSRTVIDQVALSS